ncbi:pentapeptide repeat-containing protein [Nocardia sp. NPDC059240]|uniref:pentapeptide repeat-containing protein n=1 Tax=Nocardia sp. NPDC059240 TaxID=3346786 RepID=UPI0036B261FE
MGEGAPRRRPYRISPQPRSKNDRRKRILGKLAHTLTWDGWTKLTALATTLVAVTALWFTSQTLKTTNGQYDLARDTAVTAQFSKALDQIGSANIDTRLGAISLLERLGRTSRPDRSTIFDFLSTYMRLHAPNNDQCGNAQQLAPEIQAIMGAIGRRDHDGTELIDLSSVCLAASVLEGSNLHGARMGGVNLTAALLQGVDLTGAKLNGMHAQNAAIEGATRLAGASLRDADLRGVLFRGLPLDGVSFSGADLRGARFLGATEPDTAVGTLGDTPPADQWTVQGLKFHGADFGGVRYNQYTRWPDGFVPVEGPNLAPQQLNPQHG